jgi:hypothetical protein
MWPHGSGTFDGLYQSKISRVWFAPPWVCAVHNHLSHQCVASHTPCTTAIGYGVSTKSTTYITEGRRGGWRQACAYGSQPVVLTYDGDQIDVDTIDVGAEMFLVIADLNAAKDTVRLERGAERRHPTHREREGSPTLLTLQDPILRLPWVCFGGGFPKPKPQP